jgi:hypothetical protein
VRLRALSVLCACVALAGCNGRGGHKVAPACRTGSTAVLSALRAAPGKVTLDGTPLSACVREATGSGELNDVGLGFLDAAVQLARRAERHPESTEALRLGYLVGAVHRGASADMGPASELVRRLDSEATQVDARSPAFRRGRTAGSARG